MVKGWLFFFFYLLYNIFCGRLVLLNVVVVVLVSVLFISKFIFNELVCLFFFNGCLFIFFINRKEGFMFFSVLEKDEINVEGVWLIFLM